MNRPVNLHATAIAVGGRGILLRGASRSGKSALALSTLRRAELLGLDAALVSDDQVFIEIVDGHVEAIGPASIEGLIEIAGVGIVPEPAIARVRIDLVVDLLEPEAVPRMPEETTVAIVGVALRRIVLPARQAAYGADVLHSLVLAPRTLPLDFSLGNT